MPQIIHLRTVIQSVFGVLDDDGNVIEESPQTPENTLILRQFRSEEFQRAFQHFGAARQDFEKRLETAMVAFAPSAQELPEEPKPTEIIEDAPKPGPMEESLPRHIQNAIKDLPDPLDFAEIKTEAAALPARVPAHRNGGGNRRRM